jgi:hypothetical protein
MISGRIFGEYGSSRISAKFPKLQLRLARGLTNATADKHFSDAASRNGCNVLAAELGR